MGEYLGDCEMMKTVEIILYLKLNPNLSRTLCLYLMEPLLN